MSKIKLDTPDIRETTLKHGLSFPFDEDLISMIIGSGTKEMPVEVMSKKILEILDDSNEDEIVKNLLGLKGIGKSKALAVAAAIELGKRRSNHLKAPILSPKDIIPFVRNYSVSAKEHFLVVTLNGGHEIIKIHVVTVGTLNRSLVHPREIFQVAIQDNAAAILLCHNHPSGNTSPSEEDIETTKVLMKASVIMGISILDHIIIDCETYFSFLENDVLFEK